jgi:hypothetical protein
MNHLDRFLAKRGAGADFSAPSPSDRPTKPTKPPACVENGAPKSGDSSPDHPTKPTKPHAPTITPPPAVAACDDVAAERAAILARMRQLVEKMHGPLYQGPRRP